MIANHFRIAIRNLSRSRSYTIINIGGIAIGMTAFFLFALYIADELSFDKFHAGKDSIVRVVQHETWDGSEAHMAVTSGALAPALKANFPEIQEAVRVIPEGGGMMSYQNKVFKAQNIFFADNAFFYVFTFPLLYGDSKTALASPESIVLSESLATHIFGDAKKALNEVVYFDGNFANKVTGVMKNIPDNSHLRFEAVRSLPRDYSTGWSNADQFTYLLLAPNTNQVDLEHKLSTFAAKNIKAEKRTGEFRFELQPLTTIHLHSDLDFEAGSNNSIKRVYFFALLGCLVLVIAIINYMNLSTARAFLRIREVGIRKVIGSGRRNLMALFIADALVVSIAASLVSFILITALLPLFNTLADKRLELWSLGAWQPLMLLIAFACVIGVVSGSYPAWFLSRFKTTTALKGQLGDLGDSVLLRKSLVVFQFVVTIMMISASAVIYQQLRYVANKDLGFNKHAVLTFHIADRPLRERISSMKTELLRNPAIEAVAAAGNPIGNNDLGLQPWFFSTFSGSLSANPTVAQTLVVDADFVPTMEIRVLGGRNFLTGVRSQRCRADQRNIADCFGV